MRTEDVYRTHSNRPISRTEEKRLWSEAMDGNTTSRDELLKSYYPYVVSQAIKYAKTRTIPVEDLIQEGMMGFLHGMPKWDPATGNKLMTYCAFWVDAYIRRFISDHCSTVRIPGDARRSGRGFSSDFSLDIGVGEDGATFLDMLEADTTDTSVVLESLERVNLVQQAAKKTVFRSKIRKIAQDVLKMRIVAEEPCRLQDIADIHGVSRERIRQVEVEARAALERTILRMVA